MTSSFYLKSLHRCELLDGVDVVSGGGGGDSVVVVNGGGGELLGGVDVVVVVVVGGGGGGDENKKGNSSLPLSLSSRNELVAPPDRCCFPKTARPGFATECH